MFVLAFFSIEAWINMIRNRKKRKAVADKKRFDFRMISIEAFHFF